MLCSEGHMCGERTGTGNTPLWRDDDEGRREIHYPLFALAPEMKEHPGLLGITKMATFSCATWVIGAGHLCVGHRLP